jgi:hypothetical protein
LLRFRPSNLINADELESELRRVKGVRQVVRDSGTFRVYGDLDIVDPAQLEQAADKTGNKGTVFTHEVLRLTLVRSESSDREALAQSLHETPHVLRVRHDLEHDRIELLVLKGRVTVEQIKKVVARNGYRVDSETAR